MERKLRIKNGEEIPVSEDIYKDYMRSKWREKYREQKNQERHLSLDYEHEGEDGETTTLHERIASGEDAAAMAEDRIILALLLEALESLESGEQELVKNVVMGEMSQREYEQKTGIPRKTLAYRQEKILDKLRSMIGIKKDK